MRPLPHCEFRVATCDTQLHYCRHTNVVARDNLVSSAICRSCGVRTKPCEEPRPQPSHIDAHLPAILPGPRTIAVVIPCHNYGRYLGECLDSVLAQTYRPAEILVVDDASDDETPDVAREYAEHGVEYLRVEARNVHTVRRAGFEATSSEVLCFLDADDVLARDYLQRGLSEFVAPEVTIVYSDMQAFGKKDELRKYPDDFDADLLARRNFMHAGSLVRREALRISRAFETPIDADVACVTGDWILWRRTLAIGGRGRKQRGLYRYRQHGTSASYKARGWTDYFRMAGLDREPVTLFIPLSGRTALWPELAAYLERQTWPKDQMQLMLMDTSQDAEFGTVVRGWLMNCGYADSRYMRFPVAERGIADAPRKEAADAVRTAMARIYNRLAREATTDYVWILEDDVLPPDDACERMLRGFDSETASVALPYRSRFHDGYVAWGRNLESYLQRGRGLECVAGNGFGCVMIRGSVLRNTVFTDTGDIADFDRVFYSRLARSHLTTKLDWSAECQHRGTISEHSVQ